MIGQEQYSFQETCLILHLCACNFEEKNGNTNYLVYNWNQHIKIHLVQSYL